MKILCIFRTRMANVNSDENISFRPLVIKSLSTTGCGGPVSGIPKEASCDPPGWGLTPVVETINSVYAKRNASFFC
jgi:hypothetical protein